MENPPDEKYLVYLDALRESGAVNMFGAAPFLVKRFGLDRDYARTILAYWMVTFEHRHTFREEPETSQP